MHLVKETPRPSLGVVVVVVVGIILLYHRTMADSDSIRRCTTVWSCLVPPMSLYTDRTKHPPPPIGGVKRVSTPASTPGVQGERECHHGDMRLETLGNLLNIHFLGGKQEATNEGEACPVGRILFLVLQQPPEEQDKGGLHDIGLVLKKVEEGPRGHREEEGLEARDHREEVVPFRL